MVFQCINIRQAPWEVLKTDARGLDFQHLPRDLTNFNAWKTMFDPYIKVCKTGTFQGLQGCVMIKVSFQKQRNWL